MPRGDRSFILWLHGLGDSGPANESIKTLFTSPEFKSTKWSFPSASSHPVTCNRGYVMPSWFDIEEIPITAESPKDGSGLLQAVKDVHAMIDKEIANGTDPENVFVCGLSQGDMYQYQLPPTWMVSKFLVIIINSSWLFIDDSFGLGTLAGALTLASVLLYPKTIGGGAVFSGWVPFNESLMEQFPDDAKKTPILWLHGVEDRTVLFEAGQAGPAFLEKAGVSCEFKAYPRLGHTITTEELVCLESWIKSRLKSSSDAFCCNAFCLATRFW